MFHDFKKTGGLYDDYEIVTQGSTDEAKFGRTFPDNKPATSVLDYEVVPHRDGEVIRKKIRIFQRDLTLAEIRERSSNFETLGIVSLRELIKRHTITVPPIEGKLGPDGERGNLILAVQEFEKANKPKPAVKPSKPVVIVPDTIRALGDPELETKAVRVGAFSPKWKTMSRAEREAAVSAKSE